MERPGWSLPSLMLPGLCWTLNSTGSGSKAEAHRPLPPPSQWGLALGTGAGHRCSGSLEESGGRGVLLCAPRACSGLHPPHPSSLATGDEAARGIAVEKFDIVKKWGINTYKCTKQLISERFGRGSRTVDLELETQIELLRDTKRKYECVLQLARALTHHFYSLVQTQHALGDAFSDLSQKSPELQEEFGCNAETQKLLCKNGETLLGAVNFFVSSINTLVNKTMEDTLMTVKQYETARLEYDAYRTDLEELSMGPRDTSTLCRLDAAQSHFQSHKEKYEKLRADVAIKLKFLEENKIKVMHKQLLLFHNAVSAYFAGNQQQLVQTLRQFNIKLKTPGAEKPSWLEEQ
ncbi:arfaptin-2 isoform X4 [Chelonia mydas]|uniref:arfaptin-2 isoform X4 n=1 Tax=Chelonia mydas TaxID=8469 RepID=UPI0018A1DF96|nr:arfaptin-2 isoform X4 [Chelonia mydas]